MLRLEFTGTEMLVSIVTVVILAHVRSHATSIYVHAHAHIWKYCSSNHMYIYSYNTSMYVHVLSTL